MTMPIKPLAPEISVTGQLTPEAMAAVKAAGFRTIINDRPDGEEPDQPASCYLAAAASAAGLDYYHIPVVPGQYADGQIDAFRDAMQGCAKPVLAFCRSGMRAASLWALSQAGRLTGAEIMRRAGGCGFDLAPLAPQIEARAKAMAG